MIEITVPTAYDEKKLDKFLKDRFTNLTASFIYKTLRKRDIRLNGKRIHENTVLHEGDILTLYISDELLFGKANARSGISLDIVYEDPRLILVNKMPGISVHPDKKGDQETLIALVRRYLEEKGEYHPSNPQHFPPSLCHRLDHYTGGIIIIAKEEEAYEILLEAIKNRKIKKQYQCVVKGCPDPGENELKDYLVKDKENSRVHILHHPAKGALTIITRYKVLASTGALSRLEVELITGRTHQIRAHLASIGHPVIGDDKYGDRSVNRVLGAKHQSLWAYRIKLELDPGGILDDLRNRVFETDQFYFPIKNLPAEARMTLGIKSTEAHWDKDR